MTMTMTISAVLPSSFTDTPCAALSSPRRSFSLTAESTRATSPPRSYTPGTSRAAMPAIFSTTSFAIVVWPRAAGTVALLRIRLTTEAAASLVASTARSAASAARSATSAARSRTSSTVDFSASADGAGSPGGALSTGTGTAAVARTVAVGSDATSVMVVSPGLCADGERERTRAAPGPGGADRPRLGPYQRRAPVRQVQFRVAGGGRLGVVRRQHHGGPPRRLRVQQFEHLLPVLRVELAGDLVGEQGVAAQGQPPGDRRTLLLAP